MARKKVPPADAENPAFPVRLIDPAALSGAIGVLCQGMKGTAYLLETDSGARWEVAILPSGDVAFVAATFEGAATFQVICLPMPTPALLQASAWVEMAIGQIMGAPVALVRE